MSSDPKPSRPSPTRKNIFLVGLLFLLIILLIELPVTLYPQYRIVGESKSDVWAHLWGYWRTERNIEDGMLFSATESYLNFPYGSTIYHVDLLNSLFVYPMKKLFGLPLAFNLLIWGHIVSAGIAMYLLVWHFTRKTIPSLFSALAYTFSPFVISFVLSSGVTERVNLLWLPLFFLFVFRALEHNTIKNLLIAALVLDSYLLRLQK